MFLNLFLRVVDVLVGFVLEVDDLLGSFIGLLGSLSLLDHAVDIGVGKTTAGANRNLLLLARRFVFRADVHDTVGINVERDLDLGNAARRHWDTLEVEVSELLVVLGELTLTLQHYDADLCLVVCGC